MNAVPLVFCERSGDWAAAWRRSARRPGIQGAGWLSPVVETRSPADCRQAIRQMSAAVVAVELGAASNCEASLGLLASLLRERPRLPVVALAEKMSPEAEAMARELGAAYVIRTKWEQASLAEIVGRYAALQPPPGRPVLEQIWADLPWQHQAC